MGQHARYLSVLGSVALYVLAFANVWYPLVRFASPLANRAFGLLVLLAPLAFVVVAFQIRRKFVRVFVISAASIVLLPSCVALPFAIVDIPRTLQLGFDPALEHLDTVSIAGRQFSLYRSNYEGALGSFGVLLRQECRLPLGVLLVRDLHHERPATDGAVSPFREGLVELQTHGYYRDPVRRVIAPSTMPCR